MSQSFIGGLLIIAVLTGCTAAVPIKVMPKEQPGQLTEWSNGTPTIISKQGDIIVAIQPLVKHFNFKEKPSFVIRVSNKGRSKFTFSTENISAHYGFSKLQVYDYDYLVKEAEKARKKKEFDAMMYALAGGLNSMNAAMGTPTAVSPNMHMQMAQASSNEAKTGYEYAMKEISGDILKMDTVRAGESYGGLIKIQPLSEIVKEANFSNPIQISVDVKGTTHKFTMNLGQL